MPRLHANRQLHPRCAVRAARDDDRRQRPRRRTRTILSGQLGAGQVASVDGPLAEDTITYAYDELGRVVQRAINSVDVTWAFDALGAVTAETNVLGTFTYAYDGVSGRVATVTYPNHQTSTYTLPSTTPAIAGCRRFTTSTLAARRCRGSTTPTTRSATSSRGGSRRTRRAVLWAYGYDAADQLTWAVKKTTDTLPTVLKRYVYGYDPGRQPNLRANRRSGDRRDARLAQSARQPSSHRVRRSLRARSRARASDRAIHVRRRHHGQPVQRVWSSSRHEHRDRDGHGFERQRRRRTSMKSTVRVR